MNETKPTISVIEPVGQAIEKVKAILFRPFDIGRWFVIGFCAWLAQLAGGGGSGNFNPGGQSWSRMDGHHIKHEIVNNLYWIIPVGIAVVVFFIAIGLVFSWLRCRGKFMFLHCVRTNRAQVIEPWKQYGVQGNSLFLFKLVLGLISFVCTIPFVVVFILMLLPIIRSHTPFDIVMILPMACLVLVFVLMILNFELVSYLTDEFVAPIMMLRNCRCMEGWKLFWGLARRHIWPFSLYLLFVWVVNLAISILLFAGVVMTCCLACCVLVIPYIGTVAMLPLLVFSRAYSLCYLAQYGPEWDIFQPQPVVVG